MTGMYDWYAALTGQSPRDLYLQSLGSGLTNLGAGLLSGKNWGEGLSRGLMGFSSARQNTLEDAMRRAVLMGQQEDLELSRKKTRAELEADALVAANLEKAVAQLPPDQQAMARANPEAFLKPPEQPKLMDLTGPGGVDFKVDPATWMTSLYDPSSGQIPLSDLRGQAAPARTAPPEYVQSIKLAAKQYGVPEQLLTDLIASESSFNPNAVGEPVPQWGGASAQGIAQFSPRTAGALGIDPKDPQESIFGAAQYLAQLKQKHGDWRGALAAYKGAISPDKISQLVDPLLQGQSAGGVDLSRFTEPKTPQDPVKVAGDLRGEFTKLTKDFRDVTVAYQKIAAAANDPSVNSGASDISLVFGFMKMLDPSSTVREGEFATAANSGGVPAQVWNTYNQIMSGKFLTPEQRQDFVMQAANVYAPYQRQYSQLSGYYGDLATRQGVSPQDVILPPDVAFPDTQAAFDALPTGMMFINPADGKLMRKN